MKTLLRLMFRRTSTILLSTSLAYRDERAPRRRRTATVILLAASVIGFVTMSSSCSRADSSKQGQTAAGASDRRSPRKLTIAVVQYVGHGPFFLARELGLYRSRGLDVDIQLVEDIGARRSALLAGKVDGIISSVDASAIDAAQGLRFQTVVKLGEGNGSDAIVAGRNFRTLRDLRGKTVAFPRGEPSHFMLVMALAKVGMTTKEIRPIYLSAPDAGAAFVAGKVDACVTWEPWVSTAISKGGGHALVTSRDTKGTLVDVFEFSDDLMQARRADASAFVDAWFEAVAFVKQHPDSANVVMAKSLGVPVEDLKGMLAGYLFSDLTDNMSYFGSSGTKARYWQVVEMANRAWFAEGLVKNPKVSTSFTDASVVRDLAATSTVPPR